MRILTVTNMYPSEERPGWGAFVKSQVESLADLGIDTEIIVIEGYKSKMEYVRAIGKVRKMVKSGDFDLIHAHYGLSGIVARCQFSLPVVLSFCGDDLYGHSGSDGKARLSSLPIAHLHRQLARTVRQVITKSQRMKELLPKSCHPNTTVIPNGVALNRFAPRDRAAAREHLNLKDGTYYVLFPYDPSRPRKNFALADAAIKRAKDLSQLQIEPLVIYEKDAEEVITAMHACDALVLTSYWEGSPNVVKEAMAAGLPVVSGDVGDVNERLIGVQGSGVYPHTPDAFAAGLLEAFNAPRPNNGPELIAPLSVENIAARIEQVYKIALHSKKEMAT